MSDESCFVGIDVAKAELDIALRPSGERWTVPNDAGGVVTLVERLQPLHPTLIVLEATGGLERVATAAWATAGLPEGTLQQMVLKLCSKGPQFARAYRFPGAHRTSNALDRLMNHQDRRLYAMRYLHGTPDAARLAMRAMALQWNFHPYGARTRRDDPTRRSPFHDLNGFEYHPNWLYNLLIASSMGGRKL